MRKIAFLSALWLFLAAGTTNDETNALVRDNKLEAAFLLAQQRADQGDPEGDQALAWFYDHGKLVVADKQKAAKHFRVCADAGLKHCQWRLAVMLDRGEGVELDTAEALNLLQKSSSQNYSRAYVSLGVMFAQGRGTAVDYQKAMKSYLTAARLKNEHAFYGVGVLHLLGQGTPKDKVRALGWFLVATSHGDKEAQNATDILMRDMDLKGAKKAAKIATEVDQRYFPTSNGSRR